MKLPSLNQYINACRTKAILGANMKRRVEDDISWYIKPMPRFTKPIKIKFTWIEENKRRDLDNICFGKKFILDAMVRAGKLKDDNRNYVIGFEDKFIYAKENKVILEIYEQE